MGFKRGKFTFEEVKAYFEGHGCKLLSTSYHKTADFLEFECKCGNIHKAPFRVIKQQPFPRCLQCAYIYIQENNRKNHGGVNATATPEFQEKFKKTCEEKYGVSNPMQSDTIKEKLKQTFVDKYGVEHQSQIPEIKDKTRATKIKNGTLKSTWLKGAASKQSQNFFTKLYELLPDDLKGSCLFSPLTEELRLNYKQRQFYYDFANTEINLIIEYNGSKFHPLPDLDDNASGWHFTRPYITAKQARIYEWYKRKTAENQGFKFVVVWDFEVNRVGKEKEKLIELVNLISSLKDIPF